MKTCIKSMQKTFSGTWRMPHPWSPTNMQGIIKKKKKKKKTQSRKSKKGNNINHNISYSYMRSALIKKHNPYFG